MKEIYDIKHIISLKTGVPVRSIDIFYICNETFSVSYSVSQSFGTKENTIDMVAEPIILNEIAKWDKAILLKINEELMKEESMDVRESILAEIRSEREYQVLKWHGTESEDKLTANDWVAYMVGHLGKTVMKSWYGPRFRAEMLKLAALAMASVEWYDRNNKGGDSK